MASPANLPAKYYSRSRPVATAVGGVESDGTRGTRTPAPTGDRIVGAPPRHEFLLVHGGPWDHKEKPRA
jgi:hypothetical protein